MVKVFDFFLKVFDFFLKPCTVKMCAFGRGKSLNGREITVKTVKIILMKKPKTK